jgi:hypothetical protein
MASKKSQVQSAQIPRREAYIYVRPSDRGMQRNAGIVVLRSDQTGIMTTGTVVHLSTRSATLPKLK